MYTRYKRFVADFETTTAEVSETETRVWGWGSVEIDKESNEDYGNDIESFMKWCRKQNKLIYFHNEAFDGKFIIDYLLNNGFEHVEKEELNSNTFSTLISDMGQFYSIEICFYKRGKNINKVIIHDSLKLLPMPVKAIAEGFDVGGLKKLEIDYDEERDHTKPLNELDKKYIRHDLLIVARALSILFDMGLDRMTTSSNSLKSYKDMIGKTKFEAMFPQLEDDSFIRDSYKGGFTYLQENYSASDLDEGIVYDANSMYPSVMMLEYMPIGFPIVYDGEYEYDKDYPLYVQRLTCVFDLKEGMLPTIQLKGNLLFKSTEYVKSSNNEEVTLTLTSIDLELFYKHYDVQVVEFHKGLKFRVAKGMFNEYINYYTEMKVTAKIENNNSYYIVSKLMLNALYGKFGTNPKSDRKIPYLNEKGIVSYYIDQSEEREPIYVAVASFITSYARRNTITAGQENYDRFIYADTDSIHLIGKGEAKGIRMHDTDLGAWSVDAEFTKARYIKQKMYLLGIEKEEDKEKGIGKHCKYITSVAGMRKELQEKLTFGNFRPGTTFKGDLKAKTVKGGVILFDNEYTLK